MQRVWSRVIIQHAVWSDSWTISAFDASCLKTLPRDGARTEHDGAEGSCVLCLHIQPLVGGCSMPHAQPGSTMPVLHPVWVPSPVEPDRSACCSVALLPPLQAPRRADEALVRIPPVQGNPVGVGMLLAAAVFILDQATKTVADRLLIPNRLVEIVPSWVPFFRDGFGWQLIYNPGGALGFSPDGFFGELFGLDADSAVSAFIGRWFFVTITAVVTVIVLRYMPRVHTYRAAAAYGLLLSGAWGNGIDRILRAPGFPEGQVVDFIATRVPSWVPIDQPQLARFNVADMAILAGFALLIASLGYEDRARERELERRGLLDGA
jgi:signal peptidase II